MASTTLPTLLTFPHPTLTKIHGKPTNTTIKLLRKEVYANARAIPSTHGGGAHGHLGLIMPAAEYLALAGQAFDLPAHPGAAPVHGAAATAAQIAETIRIYNATLADLATANTVRGEIKKQIIEAVDRLYLAALEDEDFGFADVTVTAMLTHLQTTYGPLTRVELEENRSSIATAWNLDDPIEHLSTESFIFISADGISLFLNSSLTTTFVFPRLLTAETHLAEAQQSPAHALAVLRLVEDSNTADITVRQAAAVHFKNLVKNGWDENREVRK